MVVITMIWPSLLSFCTEYKHYPPSLPCLQLVGPTGRHSMTSSPNLSGAQAMLLRTASSSEEFVVFCTRIQSCCGVQSGSLY